MDDLVAREHSRAGTLACGERLGLAGADSSGQADEQQFLSGFGRLGGGRWLRLLGRRFGLLRGRWLGRRFGLFDGR